MAYVIFAKSSALCAAGAVSAADKEVTHWSTSGGEAAAVAEFARKFESQTNHTWVDRARVGGGPARPIMVSRLIGGDPMGAVLFNHVGQAEELIKATAHKPLQPDAKVRLVEPPGSDTLVRVVVGDQRFWVRLDGQSSISEGDDIRIGFAPERLTLFDKDTKDRRQPALRNRHFKHRTPLMDVSFQLYSARDHTSWEDTYALLGKLGYTQVEGFGGNYADPDATRAMMEANGLTMPSGHFFPIGNFEGDFDKTIATARTLGMKQLYCPAPEDDLRNGADAAAWIALAKRMEDAAKRVQDAGLRFGWHNHHWEFMPLEDDSIPMTLILENAPSIDWEMDVAWVVRGGSDPLVWIENHKHRITAAHVKDIAPEGDCADEDGWADVGHGTLDWKGLTRALRRAGVGLFVMEHDKPSDVERFARRSIDTFKTL